MFEEFTGFRFPDVSVDPILVADTARPDRHVPPLTRLLDAYATIKEVTQAHPDLKSLFEEMLRDDGFKPMKRAKDPYARMSASPEVIEVSIWDNWLGDTPVKGHPQRFGVVIKAWNKVDVDFRKQDDVDYRATVALLSPTALRKNAANAQLAKVPTSKKGFSKTNKNPISAEFAEMIDAGCDMMEQSGLEGGLLTSKPHGYGTIRSDRQMMFVDTTAILAGDMTALAVILIDEETKITLPAWTTTDAKGKALPESFNQETGKRAKCVAQIRYARDKDRFAFWMEDRT